MLKQHHNPLPPPTRFTYAALRSSVLLCACSSTYPVPLSLPEIILSLLAENGDQVKPRPASSPFLRPKSYSALFGKRGSRQILVGWSPLFAATLMSRRVLRTTHPRAM